LPLSASTEIEKVAVCIFAKVQKNGINKANQTFQRAPTRMRAQRPIFALRACLEFSRRVKNGSFFAIFHLFEGT
jgi:hypothetical protein